MSVYVQGQNVQVSSESNNGGIFIGQNIQNGWDSISPYKRSTGASMGDYNTIASGFSGYFGWSYIWQQILDSDIKGNGTTKIMR